MNTIKDHTLLNENESFSIGYLQLFDHGSQAYRLYNMCFVF